MTRNGSVSTLKSKQIYCAIFCAPIHQLPLHNCLKLFALKLRQCGRKTRTESINCFRNIFRSIDTKNLFASEPYYLWYLTKNYNLTLTSCQEAESNMLMKSLQSRLSASAMYFPLRLKSKDFWQDLGYFMYDTDLFRRDQTVIRNWKW